MDIKKAIKKIFNPLVLAGLISIPSAAFAETPTVFNGMSVETIANMSSYRLFDSATMSSVLKEKGLKPVFIATRQEPIDKKRMKLIPTLMVANENTRQWLTVEELHGQFSSLYRINSHGIGFTDFTSTHNAIKINSTSPKVDACKVKSSLANDRQPVFETDNRDGSSTVFLTLSKYSSNPLAQTQSMISFTTGAGTCKISGHQMFQVVGRERNIQPFHPYVAN